MHFFFDKITGENEYENWIQRDGKRQENIVCYVGNFFLFVNFGKKFMFISVWLVRGVKEVEGSRPFEVEVDQTDFFSIFVFCQGVFRIAFW